MRITTHEAHIDFETYSEAGFRWDPAKRKWGCLTGASKNGLAAVGAPAYAQHPSTELLLAAYKLPDRETCVWYANDAPPQDLFDHIAQGGTLRAHNAMFERLIWQHVSTRLGWPPVPDTAWRCSMATAAVNSLPAALGDLGKALQLDVQKNKEGMRLIRKFCIPRNPTKSNTDRRIAYTAAVGADYALFAGYCKTDVETEYEATRAMPAMSADEEHFWQVDQEINARGVALDLYGLTALTRAYEAFRTTAEQEFTALTGFSLYQLAVFKDWLTERQVLVHSLDAEALEELLARTDLPQDVYRALQLRDLCAGASLKKVYSLANYASADGRLRNVIRHHGARTGRPTGSGPQPLNLPRGKAKLWQCTCGAYCGQDECSCGRARGDAQATWGEAQVDYAIDNIQSSLAANLGDCGTVIKSSLRGMFVAGAGKVLLASDYSSIEAVVIAMLAKEQWRIDALRQGQDIYLVSAARITGKTVAYYVDYKHLHGDHHPDRQNIGKVAELALGFGGGIGAWRIFDKTDTLADSEVQKIIDAWRLASPAIVSLWKAYNLAAQRAVQGSVQNVGGVLFYMRGTSLIVQLLSGRCLTYNNATVRRGGRFNMPTLYYWTQNQNLKYGKIGWVEMDTFGGRLTENIVQATAHDILRYAILALRKAGYPTVLHVYDEIVCEVDKSDITKAVCGLETIMARMPDWARGWPIRAAGGWRGRRYRKG